MRVNLASLLASALLLISAGCSTVGERNPVPFHLMPEASVPGMGPVRYWGDEIPKDVVAEFKRKLPYLPRLAESPAENGKPIRWARAETAPAAATMVPLLQGCWWAGPKPAAARALRS